MAQQVVPEQHSVEDCLRRKTYAIDFYQREYVWTKNTVEVLLNDIFYTFNLSYERLKDAQLTKSVLEQYNWYYLNIYITNNVSGKCYIVDGQQRLTTLTLIALKLMKMTTNSTLKVSLGDCIRGIDKWQGNIFWIDDSRRHDVMECLLSGKSLDREYKNKTEENLVERFKDISDYFDKKNLTSDCIDVFISYFLERLVLMELTVDKDDTPMVFEVINDRGEDLKPFEILKGKLIGSLDKNDTDTYSSKWDAAMRLLPGLENDFFVDYLKSHFVFASNAKMEESINNSYHRYIYENNEIGDSLCFRRADDDNVRSIKQFLDKQLPYYAALYSKIRMNVDINLKYCNELLYLSGQYQVILAACQIDDPEEDKKIEVIAREYERMYVLLRLNRAYDSNSFKDIYYSLNQKLSGVPIEAYSGIFDSIILSTVKRRHNLPKAELLSFSIYEASGYTNMEKRFLRYYLARIENYICAKLGMSMSNDVEYITTKTSDKRGYHIEHILSQNDTNRSYFESVEVFDTKRNQFGGLLLLKGIDNISSGNEEYVDKLKTYSAGLVWGQTLNEAYHHNNNALKVFNEHLTAAGFEQIRSFDKFDSSALAQRTKLMYQLTKIIWDVDRSLRD